MKKFVLFIVVLTFVACSQESGKEEIRKQIAQHKKEKSELQQKINQLSDQMESREGDTAGTHQIPVFVKELKPDTFRHFVNANGTVEAVQEAIVSPETNGQITEIYVEEGDRVQEGELMAKLNTSVIQSNIEEVKTNLELARKTFQKQKRLWEDSVGSEMEYLEAKNRKENLENRLGTLREQLDMSEIRAPFNGIVEEVNQKIGEMGNPGVQMMYLVNLKKLKVKSELAEQYMAHVHEGDPVRIRFPAYPEMVKTIPISRKGSVIDKGSRTFAVEGRIDNYNEKIKPNQISIMEVNDYVNDSALIVPSEVIKQDMQGDYVYILQEDQGSKDAQKVYIETGRTYNNQTILTQGVDAGEEVITSGYSEVSDGSQVQVKQREEFAK
ncbi:MAG: efflux RND transporter periplasmic adaptor subunit [Bacteroidota bacterium]